ncbi:FAD-dependent oxidoreductase [Aestuariicella hydrocarbonica]|uniref:FAD-dependent oxidoreductase n=1 Tax=Pseudomaricurvus hydrocarbonicus TaxID=1470433 RepID=A0A9E5MHK7_9GAMM|nr:NAD(P)/FAD-dependent oxidoreductase [Aestuariicella hydrocarbonica]NHO66051.1 FAD-dependent oxidoreductase [Aestuariicella hydrocarbonica]
MSNLAFSNLLAPGKIGKLELRNRMVVAAMGANFGEDDGRSGDRVLAYHEEQAKGGVGLIISGACGVAFPVGKVQPQQIAISDDCYIDGLKKVVDAVHQHGAKFALQLHHGGLVAVEDTKAGRPLWCPSIPQPTQGDFVNGFLMSELQIFSAGGVPSFKVLEKEDIQLVIQQFAKAAVRAKQAGCDAVEVHGGHGYLLSSFLSPKTNQRTDEYGGSDENRARFVVEVVRAVRSAVGPDFPVWVKLDSREVGKQGGITLEHAKVTARLVEQAGADAITVSAYHDGSQGKLHSASNIPHEPNTNLPAAKVIKGEVSIPIIASGRVEMEHADREIAAGHFDFLMMGRKLLADPFLPVKLKQGRVEDVRPCVYCYTCVSAIYTQEPMRCAVNAELGVEYTRLRLPQNSTRKRIVVIGGGPAGMELSRRLAEANQEVILIEQGKTLGGTLRFASLAYEPNQRLLEWLTGQLQKLPVAVHLNKTATPELVKSLQPDHVVVAAGAQRDMPEISGGDLSHVFSGDDMRKLVLGERSPTLKQKTGAFTRFMVTLGALTGLNQRLDFLRKITRQWMPLGKDIVIVGGDLVGLELAEFLCERGRRVTVLHDEPRMGNGLMLVRRLRILAELREHGVALQAGVTDVAIEPDRVSFIDANGEPQQVPANQVIVAKGACANSNLRAAFANTGIDVQEIGDVTGVGYIEGALRDATEVADSILSQ